MIKLTKNPKPDINTAEGIKIYEFFMCYKDVALFWEQENSNTVISMLDGNMVISGKIGDIEELKSFICMINPESVFSNADNLNLLGLGEFLPVNVLTKISGSEILDDSDELSSKEVHFLLKNGGFELPEYDTFAPDYCLRLNKGRLHYYGIKNTAVALTIGTDYVLINGIATLDKMKGIGSRCLNGVMSKTPNKTVFVCAKPPVTPFYQKNGFVKQYEAGYWRK